MIKFINYNLIILILFLNLFYGCTKIRKSAGVERKSPDEFQVIERPPLVIPPDFSLVPPKQLQQKNIDNIEQDLAEQILFGLNEQNNSIQNESSTMNKILSKTNAMNVPGTIRDEINENFANETSIDDVFQLTWENEIEVLDAVKESERIRENIYNAKSIIEGDTPIKKIKVKIKKKKRFIFF